MEIFGWNFGNFSWEESSGSEHQMLTAHYSYISIIYIHGFKSFSHYRKMNEEEQGREEKE
jgi:hypothetical protein